MNSLVAVGCTTSFLVGGDPVPVQSSHVGQRCLVIVIVVAFDIPVSIAFLTLKKA
jgi:hypothetical protein